MSKDENGFFCGNCRNKYSTQQNFNRHFTARYVFVQSIENPSQKIKAPNICFETEGPKIARKSLEKAVADYKKLAKASTSLKVWVSKEGKAPKRSLEKSELELASNKKEKLSVSNCSEVSSVVLDINENEINSTSPLLATEATNSRNTNTEHTTEILKLCREMHKQLVINKSKDIAVAEIANKKKQSSSIKEETFDLYIQSLRNAKSMSALMENRLVTSTFKLIESSKLSSDMETNFELPAEVAEHLEKTNVVLPEIISVNDLDEDEPLDNLPAEEPSKNTTHTLYCKACAHKNTVSQSKHSNNITGVFNVVNPKYSGDTGKKQEVWFTRLKSSLIRHLQKLIHHQRSAIYDLLQSKQRKSVKDIDAICSNILYFITKTNTAWILYPVLLATLYRSGIQVGNINHSVYACEQFLPLIDDQLKARSVQWFSEQNSVTVTADIGTIRGVTLLVVLLISESDKQVFFAGLDMAANKDGIYLADLIFKILTSENHLNLNASDVKQKVSGMAGDGAFCKHNEPFKKRMKEIFSRDFKFRWDLLHLVNRSHTYGLDESTGSFGLKEIMDFIQDHSSTYRSGLPYTQMLVSDVFGFKRPKLKSETRMVNYEYDQTLRFMENSKFFDIPYPILCSAAMYLLVSYVTKIILQCAQATDVSSTMIDSIFYKEEGKDVMLKVIDMGTKLVTIQENGNTVDEVLKDFIVPDVIRSDSKKCKLPVKDYLINQVCNLVKKRHVDIFSTVYENKRPTRLRSERDFSPQSAAKILTKYVEKLWSGIAERLKHFDKDGTTSWSEAPSESIFSILDYVVEHKPSLKYTHMISLCRCVREGPPPGTELAQKLTEGALKNWPNSQHGIGFTTNNYIMKGLTSRTVTNAYNK